MYKFLEVVWSDDLGGDANFQMEAHKMQGNLFSGFAPTKLELLEEEIREGILSGRLQTDGDAALYCISKGVFPSKVAKQLYRKMKREGLLDYRRGEAPRSTDAAIRDPRPLRRSA